MSARDRRLAYDRAVAAGAAAFAAGKPITDNPYKDPERRKPTNGHGMPGGMWSLHPWWRAGWTTAQANAATSTVANQPQGKPA